MAKWHKRKIIRGVYGELSKIQEELEEAQDAEEQNLDVMLLIELSDIIGAVEGVSMKKFNMSAEQLLAFARRRSEIIISEQKQKKK